MDLNILTLRQLQQESGRAMTVWKPTIISMAELNKKAHHDSQMFYRAVIETYIEEYGDLPSKIGPAKDLKLVSDD